MPKELEKARAKELANKLRYAWSETIALTHTLEEAGYKVLLFGREDNAKVTVSKQIEESI